MPFVLRGASTLIIETVQEDDGFGEAELRAGIPEY
jgi:hypothetical protein